MQTKTNRRTAIRNLLLLSAGIVLIPSCSQQKGKATIVLNNLDIDFNDETLVAALADNLIPATDTPGAREIGAHLFVLKMVDDCLSKPDQQQFIKGMNTFRKLPGQSFSESTPAQRNELLKKMETKQGMAPETMFFYNITKKYTVQAYTTSKYFLTEVQVYELAPARFHGCVPIDKKNT